MLLKGKYLFKCFLIFLSLQSLQIIAEPNPAFLLQDPLFIEKKNIGKSFPKVWKILQDQHGFIWFTSPKGLFRFDGHRAIRYQYNEKSSQGLSGHPGRALLEDKEGILWVSTRGGGLNRFDPMSEQFQSIRKSDAPNSLSNNIVSKLAPGDDEILWVGTRQGLNKIDLKTNASKRIKLLSTASDEPDELFIRAIYEDTKGNLWVGTTKHGLFVIDDKETVVKHYWQNEKEQSRLSHNTVLSVLEDDQGDIWVGTRKGIDRIQVNGSLSHYLNGPVSGDGSTNNYIATLTKDSEGRIWAGSWFNGLFLFDNQDDQFQPIIVDDRYSSLLIYDIYQDGSGMLWVGSDKGLYVTNPASLSMVQIKHNSDAVVLPFVFEDSAGGIWLKGKDGLYYSDAMSEDISHTEHKIAINDEIFSMAEDAYGVLWIGTSNGLRRYTAEDKIVNCQISSSSCPQFFAGSQIWYIGVQKENILWLGLENHVKINNAGLVQFDIVSGQYEQFESQHTVNDAVNINTEQLLFVGNSKGLGIMNKQTKEISTIYPNDINNETEFNRVIKAEKDSYWLATEGEGLIKYNIDSKKIEFTSKTVLPDQQEVLSMSFDSQGNIWMALPLSLAMITGDLKTAYQFDDTIGIRTQGYTRRKIITTQSGHIITGGSRGYLQFDPLKLAALRPKSKTTLTNFKLINKQVPISSTSIESVLKHPIHTTQELKLGHQDYLFSIQFSSLDYSFSDRARYVYKLQGLDKEWITTNDNINEAVYSTLPPGDYRFRVKIDNGSNPTAEETLLKIKILPPLWRTWWAYSFYILITLIIVFLLFWSFYRRRIAENAISFALELASTKEHLFANLSHEFRTPLTLILGPADAIEKGEDISRNITLIKRNAQRLLSMVDQLLKLAKLKGGHSRPLVPERVSTTCHFVKQAFHPKAQERNILLKLLEPIDNTLWIQSTHGALETILLNLLSNAFKYTPVGGEITLHVNNSDSKYLDFSVSDTGCGIAEAEQTRIFERFVRLENTFNYASGTGIGLALVKELVESLGGQISVTSQVGKGSTFVFSLLKLDRPKNISHSDKTSSSPNEYRSIQQAVAGFSPTNKVKFGSEFQESHIAKRAMDTTVQENSQLRILIIEDNKEMGGFLKQSLQKRYTVLEAVNGSEGLTVANEECPDLIISDVMMPIMDGFQLLKAIRKSIATSHIPVVLLTARGDRESKLRGLSDLADDYITKPFDVRELVVRINNLLSIRSILRSSFGAVIQQGLNTKKVKYFLSNKDRQFFERFKKCIDECYTDSELSPKMIAARLAIGDRQMRRKLVAISGFGFNEFLRNFRLEQSLTLLQGDLQIDLIAFQIGFGSGTYFTRCFKAKYGKTPSEYRTELLVTAGDTLNEI